LPDGCLRGADVVAVEAEAEAEVLGVRELIAAEDRGRCAELAAIKE
jgi:hypothetical protein